MNAALTKCLEHAKVHVGLEGFLVLAVKHVRANLQLNRDVKSSDHDVAPERDLLAGGLKPGARGANVILQHDQPGELLLDQALRLRARRPRGLEHTCALFFRLARPPRLLALPRARPAGEGDAPRAPRPCAPRPVSRTRAVLDRARASGSKGKSRAHRSARCPRPQPSHEERRGRSRAGGQPRREARPRRRAGHRTATRATRSPRAPPARRAPICATRGSG